MRLYNFIEEEIYLLVMNALLIKSTRLGNSTSIEDGKCEYVQIKAQHIRTALHLCFKLNQYLNNE